jgi:hypothetical protein
MNAKLDRTEDFKAFVVVMIALVITILLAKYGCGDELEAAGYWPTIYVEVDECVMDEAEFQVRVILQDATNVAGFQMELSFNRDVIRAQNVHEGVFLSQAGATYWIEPDMDNSDGVIRDIVCVRTGYGGVSGGGLLFTAVFRARRVGVSPLTLTLVKLSDHNSDTVYVTAHSGTVRVVEFPAWDVNQDGVTDLFDLIYVGQKYGQTVIGDSIPNPDVDRNGIVDIYDLVKIAQHFGENYNGMAPARTDRALTVKERAALLEIRELVSSGPEHADTLNLVNRLLATGSKVKTTTWGRKRNEG